MAISITQVTDSTLRNLGDIPFSETVYTAGQVETRIGSITGSVADYVASSVSTLWRGGGPKTAAQINSTTSGQDLLVSGNVGYVYHLSGDLEITSTNASRFMEPSGTHVEDGTDIAVIAVTSGSTTLYKFDVLGVTDSSVVRSVNGINPTNGAVTIPNSASNKDGLMTSGQYTKLSGIATGAEVNQNAFSTIYATGDSISAGSKTDTLTFSGESGISISLDSSTNTVTISAETIEEDLGNLSGSLEDLSGTLSDLYETVSGNGSDLSEINGVLEDLSGRIDGLFDETSGVGADLSSLNDVICGISGDISGLLDDISGVSGDLSGLTSDVCGMADSISQLGNLSSYGIVKAYDSSGSVIGSGTATTAEDVFALKAGTSTSLSISGSYVTVNANVPVKDVYISGGSSLVDNKGDAVIPYANTDSGSRVPGIVTIASALTDNTENAVATASQVSGAIATLNTTIAGLVVGNTLHSGLNARGLGNPTGTVVSGTLYALLAALHAADTKSET